MRTAAAVAVLLASLAAEARAEFHLSGGLGYGLAGYDPCRFPDRNCDYAPTRTDGASPLLGVGLRARRPLRDGAVQLRYGASGTFLIVPERRDEEHYRDISGSVATAAGELGLERGVWSIDMVAGLSRIRLTDEQMAANRVALAVGYVGAVRLNRNVSLFVRADAHAMMHGDAAAVFLGAGFEWVPDLQSSTAAAPAARR
ncbi:MAG: hypothetical protein KF773_10635 [Deltaproteobacteria bacterium]|nr:hypothetical protein [Deltaproteobacteria bacterium]MCW5802506.1 hypothetical protein [Deltaproteobacteria bacterium]